MAAGQKTLTGTVVSDKMAKTVVVLVEHKKQHQLYRKILRRSKRYLVHDDRFEAKPGDIVRIVETRPLSRHKRWRVAEILKRGEVPEIEAREIDREYLSREREREAPPDQAARDEAAEPAAEAAQAEEAPAPDEAEPAMEEAPPEAEEATKDAPPEAQASPEEGPASAEENEQT